MQTNFTFFENNFSLYSEIATVLLLLFLGEDNQARGGRARDTSIRHAGPVEHLIAAHLTSVVWVQNACFSLSSLFCHRSFLWPVWLRASLERCGKGGWRWSRQQQASRPTPLRREGTVVSVLPQLLPETCLVVPRNPASCYGLPLRWLSKYSFRYTTSPQGLHDSSPLTFLYPTFWSGMHWMNLPHWLHMLALLPHLCK